MNRKIIITAAITITVIIAAIGIYYLILPPAPTSETPPEIIGHTHFNETVKNTSITFYKVIGVVQNNLETNIESVNVTATFFDAENNVVAIRNSSTESKIIEPNQRVPFEVYLLLDPTIQVPDRYELTLSYVKTKEKTITGLEIVNRTWSIEKATGYHIIRGEVQNKGRWKASGVKILCTYYDSDGNVKATSRTYVSSVINAGEKVAFEISSKPHKISPVSDFELLIVTHRYEVLPIANYVLLAILTVGFVSFIVYMKKRRGW